MVYARVEIEEGEEAEFLMHELRALEMAVEEKPLNVEALELLAELVMEADHTACRQLLLRWEEVEPGAASKGSIRRSITYESMTAGTVTTVRLPPEDLKRLAALAEQLKVDRSSLIRRALDAGVREILVEEAARRYQRGEASAWVCARAAGVNLLVFLDELKARGVPFRTDEDLLAEQLEELRRARRRR